MKIQSLQKFAVIGQNMPRNMAMILVAFAKHCEKLSLEQAMSLCIANRADSKKEQLIRQTKSDARKHRSYLALLFCAGDVWRNST